MYSDTFNSIMTTQEMADQYYYNMQNRFTPGAVEENVYFTDYYNAYQASGGPAPKYAVKELNFSQGKVTPVDSPTSLAIEGNGFFVVSDGRKDVYTRNGKFTFKDGALIHPNGLKVKGYALDESGQPKAELTNIEMSLDPETKLYNGKYTGYKFDEYGTLYGQETNIDPITKNVVTNEVPLYRVAVATFANSSGLRSTGLTIYTNTENSGPAVVGTAGQGALGMIKPQNLELSNVDYVQQAYKAGQARQASSANFAVIKAQDEINKMSINLIK